MSHMSAEREEEEKQFPPNLINNENQPAPNMLKVWLAVFALAWTYGMQLSCTYNLIAYVSTTIVANFGPDALAQVSWVSSAWTVPCAVVVTISGRLSDIFGRRNFFLACNLFGLVGSAISGTAKTYSVLVGGAALCGIGGGLANGTIAAASELLPNKHRALGIAILELSIAPLGYFSGNVIAHVIVSRTTYHWIYYIGIIQSVIGFILIGLFYWPEKHPLPENRTVWQELKKIDWIGLLLFAAGLVVLLLGICYGGGLYPWTNIRTYLPVVIGFLTLVAFGAWCWFQGDEALIPPRLFRGNFRGFTSNMIVCFVAGMVFFSGAVIWPIQVGNFYSRSFVEIGILGIPQGAGFLLGGVVIGALAPYLGSTRWQLVLANTWQGIFLASMSALTPSSRSLGIALVFLANIPYILIVNLTFLHAQFGTDPEDIGVACGVLNTARFTGGAVSVPIYIAILTNFSNKYIPSRVSAAALGAGLPQSSLSQFLATYLMPGGNADSISGVTASVLRAADQARLSGSASAYRIVYLVSIAFSVVAISASFFTKDVRKYFTDHISVNLQSDAVKAAQAARVKA